MATRTAPPAQPEQPAIVAWWMEQALDEALAAAAKAKTYGSYDLEMIGRQMADTLGIDPSQQTPATLMELGISFNALGKVARIMSAWREGRTPDHDSWHDLGVYARMATRVKEVGQWP